METVVNNSARGNRRKQRLRAEAEALRASEEQHPADLEAAELGPRDWDMVREPVAGSDRIRKEEVGMPPAEPTAAPNYMD